MMWTAATREVALFLLVGGTSAALYVVLGVFLTAGLGMRPSISIAIALAVIMPPTYLLQKHLTFRSTATHRVALTRYLATQAISNAAAMAGSELFAAQVRAYPWLAFIGVAVLVACLNYLLAKHWAFRAST